MYSKSSNIAAKVFCAGVIVTLFSFNERLNRLENPNKGSVEVFLGDIPDPPGANIHREVDYSNYYTGPHLYNNHTKIVFYDKNEFNCLAENIYYEARGEPYIGKIAVAHITYNRAEKVGSFCEVVHKPKQFSWTSNKKIKRPEGVEWKASIHAAKMFVRGVRVKNLENTDHYHAVYVSPSWNSRMRKTADIGGHIFYASK